MNAKHGKLSHEFPGLQVSTNEGRKKEALREAESEHDAAERRVTSQALLVFEYGCSL